jgi:quinolinate synthase
MSASSGIERGRDVNPTEIRGRIDELKHERRAVILAHNYQLPEVQDTADFIGDSLELSRKAAVLDADVIVFCGVRFMAETAAILSPEKSVFLPEPAAGCPMADMITGRELRMWKDKYPGRPVVCYVNTSAEVKAESDICCTSSNAIAVVNSLGEGELLFVPDKNLAAYVARETGRRIIAWDGYCYVHHKFRPEDIRAARAGHPGAEVWVHPECPLDVIDLADKVLSTGKMVAEARTTKARDVILGTEKGILYRLGQENPSVRFHPAREAALCVNMKMTTLGKVLDALEGKVPPVTVPPAIAARARTAIQAMIKIS